MVNLENGSPWDVIDETREAVEAVGKSIDVAGEVSVVVGARAASVMIMRGARAGTVIGLVLCLPSEPPQEVKSTPSSRTCSLE
jgi:hypothetical protein